MTTVFENLKVNGLLYGTQLGIRSNVAAATDPAEAAWTGTASLAYADPTLTITGLAAGATRGTIDGVEPAVGGRVLIKDAGAASAGVAADNGFNGIWEVTGGASTTSLTLVRDSDMLDGDSALGIIVTVNAGTTNALTTWIATSDVTVASDGTNDIVFDQTDVRGTLSVARGGTGTSSLTPGTRVLQVNAATTAIETTTAPVATQLRDTNLNELFIFTATASAVNEITYANAATTANPSFTATGGDANVGIDFQGKGTGIYRFLGTSSQASAIQLFEDTSNGTNFIGLSAPAAIAGDFTLTLPSADGNASDIIETDGSGNLTFIKKELKQSVRVATIANGTLASDFENGDTIDGVVLSTGDRILIKNQTTGTENGIYVVNASGAPTRAADFATGASVAVTFTFVSEGTVNEHTGWIVTNNSGSDTVGTDAITFTLFTPSGAGSGDVVGPGIATDNAIARFDGTTGKLIQNSGVIVSDTNSVTGVANLGISTGIIDTNSNELLTFTTTASAVNEFTLANAATGTNPQLSVTGDDANIGFDFQAVGTGRYNFLGTSSQSARLSLFEDTDNGSNRLDIIAPSALGGDRTWTLQDSSDTFVGRATTDTLTNKTITAVSNNVAADSLKTATGVVTVSAATAPSTGQVLTATSATAANWQNFVFGSEYEEFTSTALTTTTNTETTGGFVNKISATTASKPIGTYMVNYVFDWSNDNSARDILAQVTFDGASGMTYRKQPRGSAGTDTDQFAMGAGAGTDQREKCSGFFTTTTVSAATHAIILRFVNSDAGSGGGVCSISAARIQIWRVA